MRRIVLALVVALTATLLTVPASASASTEAAVSWQLSPSSYLPVVQRPGFTDSDYRFVTGTVGHRYTWYCNQYTNGAIGFVLNSPYDDDWIIDACIVQSQQNKIAYQEVTLLGLWSTYQIDSYLRDVSALSNWAKEGVIYTGNTCYSATGIAKNATSTMSRRYECWSNNQYGVVGDTVQAYSHIQFQFAAGLQAFPPDGYFDIFGPSLILG